MYKDVKEVIDLMVSGNSTIWLIILAVFVIWMYKEIRNKYLKDYDFETSRIDKILEVYGSLEIIIAKKLKYSDNEIEEEMYKLFSMNYAYLSRDLYRNWKQYYLNPEQEKLETILEKIRSEISELNYEQANRIDINKKDIIEYYMRSLKPFITPMMITTLTIILLFAVLMLVFYVMNPQNLWYRKVDLVLATFTGYLSLLFLYVFINLLLEKRIVHGLKNWFITSITLIGIGLVVTVKYTAIIFLPWLIYYMFVYFSKFQIKNDKSNTKNMTIT